MSATVPPYRDLGSAPLTPPVIPRLWTLFVASIAAAFAMVLGLGGTFALFMVVFAWRIVHAGGSPPSANEVGAILGHFGTTAPGILAQGLVTVLVFAGVASLGGALSADGARSRLRLEASRRWFATGLVAAAPVLGIGMISSQVAVALGLSESGTLPMLRRAFAHVSPPVFVLALLIVGVGAGVGEELFFRGYLLTRLEERVRPWLANVCVAFFFGLVHFDPVHSTFAFFIGLTLGWTARRSGSIRPTIVAHATNNLIGVVSMTVAGTEAQTWSAPELGAGFALAIAGLAGVWALTRDRST